MDAAAWSLVSWLIGWSFLVGSLSKLIAATGLEWSSRWGCAMCWSRL